MALKPNKINWLGKVSGHVKQAKTRFKLDADERKAAEALPPAQNIILTRDQVRNPWNGEWNAGRILMTTLGGKPRQLTANDLKQFQHNMRTYLDEQGKKPGNSNNRPGLTARQIIDFAGGARKKRYSPYGPSRQAGFDSDIDKARREITTAVPVSMHNGTIRFLTPAGKDSKHTRHAVIIELLGWNQAVSRLGTVDSRNEAAIRKIANELRHAPIAFDCDCERHRYFFRFVATLGGFNAGRREEGFPKITNPGLKGVACKHVLRAVTELESSSAVLKLLTKHLMAVHEAKARSALSQKAAEELLASRKSATQIRTSDQRAELAKKAAIRRAMKAAQKKPTKPPKKRTARTRRTPKFSKELIALAKQWGMKPEALQKLLEQNGTKV